MKRCIIFAAVSTEEQTREGKSSITDQLTRQRERAARNQWIVTDEIIIEGFSRRYYTFSEFAEAAANEGHADALRMFDHWAKKDFEVLSCRDLSRLGREQSILSEVIARTIDAGAVIMPLDEAPIDATNYRMHSAISGIGASEHIDKLVRYRAMGMAERVKAGKRASNVPLFFYTDSNDMLRPDRAKYQRLFDDFAELFLLGTSYNMLPERMAERGHVRANGKPHTSQTFKMLMARSLTWGHNTFNRTGKTQNNSTNIHFALWATGRGTPPEGVLFVRDVCEPIWSGEMKEAMIDEFERRLHAIRGSASPSETYAFTSLCVCAECGRNMVIQNNKPLRYMVCNRGRLLTPPCPNRRFVRYETIQDFVDAWLAHIPLSPSDVTRPIPDTPPDRLTSLDKDLARLEARIDALMDVLSEAPVNERATYQQKITALTSQREALQAERVRVVASDLEADHLRRSREAALKILADDSLWAMDGRTANQLLRKILGNLRILCNDGEVVGMRDIKHG